MIKEIEILVLIDNIEKIDEVLKEYKYVTVIKDYEELKEKLSDFDYVHSRIAIIDLKHLTDDNTHVYTYLTKDLMYKSVSLVAYGEDISLPMRKALYGIDFKGIIDATLQETKSVIHHATRRSNLYASNFANNFLRAVIEYSNIEKDIKKLTYLLDYLIYKYEISNKDASDIRLVLISLILAFKNGNILKFASTLKTIFKSEEVDSLYRNYSKPKRFEEKIIAVLLKIYNANNPSKYVTAINMKNVEPVLVEEIQDIYDKKMLNIASYQDINFFCDQFSLYVSEYYPHDDISLFSTLFDSANHLLTESLLYVYYFSVSIIIEDTEKIEVRLQYINSTNEIMKAYIDKFINNKKISIEFIDDYTMSIVFIKNVQEKIHVNRVVDVRDINNQHYSEDKKISAAKFLEEFAVDQSLLDELHDNELDMNNLLFVEETLSQKLLDQISVVLQRYANILKQTIEFVDLSVSLESLSATFNNTSLETLESSKKEMIHSYVQGLINDLGKWKTYIFIEPNTPDIHYLDASLLENCSEIEKYILLEDNSDEREEDDLEFF